MAENRTRDGWIMNLQLFAEAAEAEAEAAKAESGGGAEAAKAGEKQEKLLTQAEVDAMIDRRFAKIQREHEKKLKEARDAGFTEGEKRARMSEEERLRTDREAAERESAQREKALAERETAILRRELRADAMEKLAAKQLPTELAELADYTDADACEKSLETIEKAFRASVQAGIDERIRASGGSVSAGGRSKADTSKMSDAEYYASLKK